MKRKAQITIIIIIGIVLLFVFAGVLFIINKTNSAQFEKPKEVIISKVPQEFNPVKKFTDDCLQSVAEKGLVLLGQQGGYIYPDLAGEFKKDAPTESAGIAFEPAKIPYWWYVSSKNPDPKITYSSLQPSLKKSIQRAEDEMTIEKQLARYVKERLNDECLKDYASFKETGFTVKAGKMETTVSVNPTEVGIYLDYPLEISKGGVKSNPEKFYVSVPLNLQKIYSMASLITEAEKNFSFLETHVQSVYQVFTAINAEKLPPTAVTTFHELVPSTYWKKSEVKEKVKGLLSSYIPLLKIQGTSNFYRYEYDNKIKYPEIMQSIYDSAGLGLQGAEGLKINFDYLNWEPYFETNQQGEIIAPRSQFFSPDFLSLFGFYMSTNDYNTVYDLSWPVMITITDQKAFGGMGYSFSFALEGNIRNNAPAKPEQVLPAPIVSNVKSLVCDKEKMASGPLVFNLIDSYDKKPLEKVQLGISFPPTDTCILGLTNSAGKFEGKVPSAYGGVVNFIKTDYLIGYYPINTYKLKDKKTVIGYATGSGEAEPLEMYNIKTINATIKKLNLNKCIGTECYPSNIPFKGESVYSFIPQLKKSKHQYYISSVSQPLKETEQGLITLKKVADIKKGAFSQDFNGVISVTGTNQMELRLVPGVYEVTGTLIYNEKLVIPEEERCKDIDILGGLLEEEECFTMEKVVLEKFMAGIFQWDKEKIYLRITPEDLYSSQQITFYLPSQNLGAVPEKAGKRVIEDIQAGGEMTNISELPFVRAALEPRWS